MKKYCFDTSGLSTPLELMPEDIHGQLWKRVREFIETGQVAVTQEILDEMLLIGGSLGECIKANKSNLVLEVSKGEWDWLAYAKTAGELQVTHHDFISENCGNTPKTVCLNDISIVAMGKVLGLPVISSERPVSVDAKKKRKIPDVCKIEGVKHLTFNDFLRAEKITN